MAPEKDNRRSLNRAHWTRVSLRAKGVAALAVPMAALFAALFSIYWAESEAAVADRTVTSAYDTREGLLQFHVFLLAADSDSVDYAATGHTRFLSAYNSARDGMQATLRRLEGLVLDDPASAETLKQIERSAAATIAVLDSFMSARGGADTDLRESAQALAREVQTRLDVMDKAQDLRLLRARFDREAARQRLFRMVLVCGILGPLGALFVHLLLTGRVVRRLQAVGENARRLADGFPLEAFPGGDDEIAELARQLEYAAGLLHEREAKLRESERRHRELFDQAPVPYEETGLDGVVRRCNQAACEMLRCSPGQMLGRRAWDYVEQSRRESFRAAMLGRIAAGVEPEPFECELVLEDGARIPVEVRENLIRDEFGAITGVCRSLIDITERRKAAESARVAAQYSIELLNKNEELGRTLEAARAATVAKGRFLAGVSHELRTPLNGIIGLSEMMHDGRIGEVAEEQRECLGDVLRSARHLLGLINDVLDFSKAEAGKISFRPQRCDITALTNEVRDVLRTLAEEKNIRLSVDAPAGFTALTDASRFKQILYNYLSNAVKFTHEGGRVDVRITRDGDSMFRLEVEDTGIGIPPAEMGKLFQEFQQIPNARKSEQGTGLGLALTRHIVESQGGRVEARSVPGEGSVFAAVLPQRLPEPEDSQSQAGLA